MCSAFMNNALDQVAPASTKAAYSSWFSRIWSWIGMPKYSSMMDRASPKRSISKHNAVVTRCAQAHSKACARNLLCCDKIRNARPRERASLASSTRINSLNIGKGGW